MSEGVDSWLKQAADKIKQTAGAGQALGEKGYQAIRDGATRVMGNMPKSATEAGRMAGQGVNAAEAGVEATKTAAKDVASGFKEARGATPASTTGVNYDTPPGQRGFRGAPGRTPGVYPNTGYTSGPYPAMEATSAPQGKYGVGSTNQASAGLRGDVGRMGGPNLAPPGSTPAGTPGGGFQKDAVSAAQRMGGGGGTTPPTGAGVGGLADDAAAAAKPSLIGKAGRMAGKALGFAGKVATPAIAGYGVMTEAADQMNTTGIQGALSEQEALDAQRDKAAETNPFAVNSNIMRPTDPLVQNRLTRMKGMMDAGLNAINPLNMLPDSLNPMAPSSGVDRRGKNFGVPPGGSPTLGQQPVQPGQTATAPGMIQTNQGAQTPDQLIDGTAVPASGQGAFRRTGGQGVKVGGGSSYGGMLPDLPKDATPEQAAMYLQKSQDLGAIEGAHREGLRKDLAQINYKNPFAVGSGPSGAIAGLAAYGAMSRMQKNEADLGVRKSAVDAANAKTASEAADRARTDLRKQQETNRATMDKEMEDYGRTKAGPMLEDEKPEAYEGRVKGELSKVRQDINYSLANRKDGKKLEDLQPAERQQLLLAKTLKDRVEASRGDIGQSLRDFLGNKRFDSKDLYTYIPKSVEPTITGGYKVVMGNGNTMTVTRAVDGSNNWLGPNGPIDADVMALISPLVEKHENKQKGK